MQSKKERIASIVRVLFFTICLGVIFVLGVRPVTAQTPGFTPRDEMPEDYPDLPGREDTFYACSACHGFKLVAAQGMTRGQWNETLDYMVQKQNMAKLDDKEKEIVLRYLTGAFPPKAPAKNYQNPFLKN